MKKFLPFLLLVLIMGIGLNRTQPVSAQPQPGVITRTTAEIMAYDAVAPRLPGVQIKRERTNEARQFLLPLPTDPTGVPLMLRGPLPQTPGLEFTGATLAETNAYPPDTMGTVGPTQYVVALNGRIRVFDKATGTLGALDASPNSFFADFLSDQYTYATDPRIRYDRLTQRWILVMIDKPYFTFENRVMIGVSDSSTITGTTAWSLYYFDVELVTPTGNNGCMFDYPTLGVDVNALYIGGLNFCSPFPNYTGSTVFVVRKAFMSDQTATSNLNSPSFVTAFRNISTEDTQGIYVPQGVDNYDPAATQGYFIGTDELSNTQLVLKVISNPATATPAISNNILIPIPQTAMPLKVPHQGNENGANGYLDTLDDRLMMAVMRDGRLWTTHNIGVNSSGGATTPTRNAVRWYEIALSGSGNGTTGTVQQSGTIYDPAASNPAFYWFPSIMVSGQGHAVTGFSAAGNTLYPSAALTGRVSTDLSGTMADVTLYQPGDGAYNPPADEGNAGGRRWGDYSYTSLDPCDDMTLWTIQQYTNAANSYGTQVLQLKAPPPALPPALMTIERRSSAYNLTIYGDTIDGRGFYDTGAGTTDAGCRKRLRVVIGGKVVVNSVTYIDPATILVNVSTANTTLGGTAKITIINPDGQRVIANATIVDGSPSNLVVSPQDDESIKLTWKDNATTEKGFLIEQSTDNLNWTPVGRSRANDKTFTAGGLTPNTTYYFRVYAILPSGPSGYSEIASAITLAAQNDVLINGDFEGGMAAGQPNSWTPGAITSDRVLCDGLASGVPIQFHSRTIRCAYRFVGGTGEKAVIAQTAVIPPATVDINDTYNLNFWYQTKGTGTPKLRALLTVTYTDTLLKPTKKVLLVTAKAGQYQPRSVPALTALGEVATVKVTFQNQALAGQMYIDDVKLIYTANP